MKGRPIQLPNSRFTKLPSPAIDWKIWKALYSRGWLFGWSYVTVATVLMLLWPLKMLSFDFCNVLDWTGLDLTYLLTYWT